jgi:hypothetical protein
MGYLPAWLPPERALDLVIDLQRELGPPGPPDVVSLVFELSSAVLDGAVPARRDGKQLTADEVKRLAQNPRRWRGRLPENIDLCAQAIRDIWGTLAANSAWSAADPVSSAQQPQSAIPSRSRTKSKADSDRVRRRIGAVVEEAKRRWGTPPKSLRNAARILADPSMCPQLGDDRLTEGPIRDILSGSYPPMIKHHIPPPWPRKSRAASGLT